MKRISGLICSAWFAVVFAGGVTTVRASTGTTPDTLEERKQLAEQGDVRAQFVLGNMHHEGLGAPRNYVESERWFRKAAEQGHLDAQHALAHLYVSKHEGIQQSAAEAAKWFRLAAEKGHAESQGALGNLYATGQGVTQDHIESNRWLQRAADQGLASAQYALGVKYLQGHGVERDEAKAAPWFLKAADSRHTGSYFALGLMHLEGRGAPKDYTAAYALLRLADANGDRRADEKISKLIDEVIGTLKDPVIGLIDFQEDGQRLMNALERKKPSEVLAEHRRAAR